MHGIDHLFKRESLSLRLFWLACFIASACVCSVMIGQSIAAYFAYDTVTKADEVNELRTDFPAVSICSTSAFMTNASYEFVEQLLVDNGLVSPLAPASTFNNVFADTLQTMKYFAGTNALSTQRNDSFRQSLGYPLEDMLLSCTYNLIHCNATDFTWYFDTLYGNCYKFNGGIYANGTAAPIMKSSKPGSVNGLSIELFLYEPTSVMSLSNTNGAYIVVNNQTVQPSFLNGFTVGTGIQSNIEVQRSFSYHLEKPYSGCTQNITEDYPSQLVKITLSNGYAYTQVTCFNACYQRYLIEKCNCYDVSFGFKLTNFTSQSNLQPCTTFTEIKCDEVEFSAFFSQDVASICGPECPQECNSITYNYFISQADYPSQTYAQSLMNNPTIQAKFASNLSELTYDNLKRSMAQINIFYGDLGYSQYVEAEKISTTDLIASIGGTLGLFLGMSFLSFIEIIDVFLQIFVLMVKLNKKRQNKITNTPRIAALP